MHTPTNYTENSLLKKAGGHFSPPQLVEKPEIQENWILGFNSFIIKIAKYENTEEELS